MRSLEAGCMVVALLFGAGCANESVTGGEADASLSREGGVDRALDRGRHAPPFAVAILDACDPDDPTWLPTGGCSLRRGDVTNAEFGQFLVSPLTVPPMGALVGHPAWRNEPSYLSIPDGRRVVVANAGGRLHTFTEVAAFGGGRVPPLNIGLTPAPECMLAPGETDPTQVMPGQRMRLDDLEPGVHRFMCCFHPWMRATIRVGPERDHRGH